MSETRETIFFRAPETSLPEVRVHTLHGREALSELYEFRVEFHSETPLEDADVTALLTHGGHLAYGEDGEHKIHGAVRALEETPDATERAWAYALTLVPRLWYTTQTLRSRVFLAKSVPDIVRAVLGEAGLEQVTYNLSATHPVREYTVQYQETDFAFVSRLLESEGIFYYFEQGDAHETLVLADGNASLAPLAGHASVPFRPMAGALRARGAVTAIRRVVRTVPRLAFARDFNPALPSSVLANDRRAAIDEAAWPSDRVGHGLLVEYGERLASVADANRVARLRAEEALSRKEVYAGQLDLEGLHPGHVFALEQHWHPALAREYLLTAVEHHAVPGSFVAETGAPDEGPLSYSAEFEAIPKEVAYRPARVTPRPVIAGVIHAKIDGQNGGTAAPVDDAGRYRVLLPFDTVGQVGGRASCPMRLAQPSAGPGYGLHAPLHQGTEVLIAHAQGDPDQPVILAAVPNPETPSPFVSPQNVRGGLVSRSAVRIEFDDDA